MTALTGLTPWWGAVFGVTGEQAMNYKPFLIATMIMPVLIVTGGDYQIMVITNGILILVGAIFFLRYARATRLAGGSWLLYSLLLLPFLIMASWPIWIVYLLNTPQGFYALAIKLPYFIFCALSIIVLIKRPPQPKPQSATSSLPQRP